LGDAKIQNILYQAIKKTIFLSDEVRKNLKWQNPGLLGFAALPCKELFVAQELIIMLS
jgi:hypothetical protein